jgi:hypothetical protein
LIGGVAAQNFGLVAVSNIGGIAVPQHRRDRRFSTLAVSPSLSIEKAERGNT